MVWSRISFLITIPAEFPGNLRSRNRIQKKLKLPWKLNAMTATLRVCLQSIFSLRERHWWTKSPPANRQPYSVTLVTHGKRRTCLKNGFIMIAQLLPPSGMICSVSVRKVYKLDECNKLYKRHLCQQTSVASQTLCIYRPVFDGKRSQTNK